MSISANQVKELRERTGVGIMDCKQALQESSGDVEEAVKILRKMGKAKVAKKASREASEGRIEAYVHMGGKIAVMLELNCETDFVAKSDDFVALARDIAMHIAASNPRFVKRDDVDEDALAEEREVFRAQAEGEGKPAEIVEKIVSGKIDRHLSEVVLYEQAFVKDPDHTIADLIGEAIHRLGENIVVGRFVRFAVGESDNHIAVSA
ncbi:MAG: translation elongation factor Ts [Acidobacteriota bacterium]|jgi:elongation factor Ts